jgi:hypothetical protein
LFETQNNKMEIKIMKTKFIWLALLASAALIAQAQAGGHRGGGGDFGGGFASAGPAAARGGGVSFSHAMPMGNLGGGGGRIIYSAQRFAPPGVHSSPSTAIRPRYTSSNGRTSIGSRQFTAGNNQVRNGTSLPPNWRNQVVAQHSANWQRNWDRSRDHVWRGHHCRFINGSWVIFNFGFYPWWPYWNDDYYPGYYTPYIYEGEDYYGVYDYSSDQYGESTVAAAQEQLAQQGYYRGEIDGLLGPETRRAIVRFQSDHGLRVTGALTTDTLQTLGLLGG